jgi:hypothetical protein
VRGAEIFWKILPSETNIQKSTQLCPRPFIHYIQLSKTVLWSNLYAVANGAITIFKPRMMLFYVSNGAMNASLCWQRRNELLRDIGNKVMNSSAMTPVAMLRPLGNRLAALQRERLWKSERQKCRLYKARWMFIPALANCFQIANSCTWWPCSFKRLSQQGGWEDFSQILGTSLFNDDLSNEPNFGQIHLAGQYL